MKRLLTLWLACAMGLALAAPRPGDAAETPPPTPEMAKVAAYVEQAWRGSGIPGLALAAVDGGQVLVKGYGLASLDTGRSVTPETLFEIGSCTKAFTGLALACLRAEAGLDFQTPVADLLPLFYGLYQDRQQPITLDQLLHHTSGIPDSTIMTLPAGDQDYALKKTTMGVSGLNLAFIPGSQFSYATVNYDVAAMMLAKVSGQDYADYLAQKVLQPLGLSQTLVGCQAQVATTHPQMAAGYKVGFMRPQAYLPPPFRGNFPAGYVISNAQDMARWLRIQLGLEDTALASLIRQTHAPNPKVPADPGEHYGLGWYISDKGIVHHDGVNPTFTAFVGLDPATGKGVAVLTNYNSSLAGEIGWGALAILLGRDPRPPQDTFDYPLHLDKQATIACAVLGFIGLLLALVCLRQFWGILFGRRRFAPPTAWRFLLLGLFLLLTPVVVYQVYVLPATLLGANWEAMAVWGPISLVAAAKLILADWFLILGVVSMRLLFPRHRPGLKA
ncbi:MAG: serine hydrolase domain-containing protein [Pseudomonadota bacterium]